MKNFILSALVLLSLVSFAQRDTSFFYMDKDLQMTSDPKALYKTQLYPEQSAWRYLVKNTQTQKTVVRAFYTNQDLQTLTGAYEAYYDDGTPKSAGNYYAGKNQGWWKKWYPDGRISDSLNYLNGSVMMSYSYKYAANGNLIQYNYKSVSENKYISKAFSNEGELTMESDFTGLSGNRITYFPGGKIASQVKFDDKGNELEAKHFKQDGTEMTAKEFRNWQLEQERIFKKQSDSSAKALQAQRPEFTANKGGFSKYAEEHLKIPSSLRNTLKPGEEIVFSMMLDEKGRAYDLRMIKPVNGELEKSIKDLLRTMPSWNMKGMKNYGPVMQRIRVKY